MLITTTTYERIAFILLFKLFDSIARTIQPAMFFVNYLNDAVNQGVIKRREAFLYG